MIRTLTISSFKSFRETATVPLAPLTLIYGGNSGGKSTIIQTIMLLKQSLESAAAPSTPLVFSSDAYLDLGNFQNVISDHDITRSLILGISVENRIPQRRIGRELNEFVDEMRILYNFRANAAGSPELVSMHLRLDDSSPPLAIYERSSEKLSRQDLLRTLGPRFRARSASSPDAQIFQLTKFDFESPFFEAAFRHFMDRMQDTRRALVAPEDFEIRELEETLTDDVTISTLRERMAARFEKSRWWLERLTNYDIRLFRDDFQAFSSTRLLLMDRFVPSYSVVNPSVRADADEISLNQLVVHDRPIGSAAPIFDLAQALTWKGLAIQDEFEKLSYVGPLREFPERNYIFSAGGEKTVGLRGEHLPGILFSNPRRLAELNRLANLMNLGYEISVHRSLDPELDNVFAVRLTDLITKARVGITDVGFGVSQILPILLQCALRDSGCIVMEQPEIHLNPKLQAALAEVFASAVSGGRQQLVVETHSEHLLLRLQRMIREGRFDSKLLSVVYVSKSQRGSAIVPIAVGSKGDQLTPWPDGFFDDTYRELFG